MSIESPLFAIALLLSDSFMFCWEKMLNNVLWSRTGTPAPAAQLQAVVHVWISGRACLITAKIYRQSSGSGKLRLPRLIELHQDKGFKPRKVTKYGHRIKRQTKRKIKSRRREVQVEEQKQKQVQKLSVTWICIYDDIKLPPKKGAKMRRERDEQKALSQAKINRKTKTTHSRVNWGSPWKTLKGKSFSQIQNAMAVNCSRLRRRTVKTLGKNFLFSFFPRLIFLFMFTILLWPGLDQDHTTATKKGNSGRSRKLSVKLLRILEGIKPKMEIYVPIAFSGFPSSPYLALSPSLSRFIIHTYL